MIGMQPVTCALEIAELAEREAALETQASRIVTAENRQILGQVAKGRGMSPAVEAPGDALAVMGPTVVVGPMVVAVTADFDNIV